ncbi:MAG: hypothetical protein PHW95_01250 [Patescibacteria group bacterium]|nr:hypothetical protein [Patescibacteria group bacterium]
MYPDEEQSIPDEARENEHPLLISQINPENRAEVARYYQFEIDQGFSGVNPNTTFDKMIDLRQRQIVDGQLKVARAMEGDQLVATSVVVLENGAMGKEVKPTEAYAAGTVVLDDKRGRGIGERMASEQDNIARAAGKESILTVIANYNSPSMRLRMSVGYVLEGINEYPGGIDYAFRKNLIKEQDAPVNWVDELRGGRVSETDKTISDSSPEQIIIDPADDVLVKEALENGYRGLHLLRPQDFGDKPLIDKNMIVFSRERL